VLDQVGFSHAPLSNKLQKKLMHMLGAYLNKNERAMLQACWERIARCVAASRKGICAANAIANHAPMECGVKKK